MRAAALAVCLAVLPATAWAQPGTTTPEPPAAAPPTATPPAPPTVAAPPPVMPMEAPPTRPFVPQPAYPPAPYEPPRTEVSDAKLGAGIATMGVGAIFVVAGGVLFDDSQTGGECPPTIPGQPMPSSCGMNTLLRGGSLAMLVGGSITTAMGAFVTIVAGAEGDAFPHRSNGLMASGILLTALGAAGVMGAGAMWYYAALEDSELYTASATMFAASATFLAAGAPMWAAGAMPPHAVDDPRAKATADGTPDSRYVTRSPAMLGAGVFMTVGGVTGLIAGSAVAGDVTDKDERQVVVVGNMLAVGTLLGAGIPFIVHGAGQVPPIEGYSLKIPEVNVGPGSGSVRWRF